MTREITHMRAFTAALESMEKPPFSIGVIKPTPGLLDQYFNASTGADERGNADKGARPWKHDSGLHLVSSEIEGGELLNITPYDPQPGTEVTSPMDSTPVGEVPAPLELPERK